MSKALSSDISGNPLFIMLMFVLVIIIFLAIFRSVSPFLTMGIGLNAHIGSLRGSFQIEAFENQEKSKGCFVLFYAPWCGHCKSTLPEFEALQLSYKGPIQILSYNSEDPDNREIIAQQDIKGFPTIRYYKDGLDGEYSEYNNDRNEGKFKEYISKITGVLEVSSDNAAPVDINN